ncbi:unnamed protein product [Prorocentrum cordatum]|uniref:Uncharacterized protein n=1 Tax=Prorocentrum cordatum TaxID=2364126 RepID=A0ABN9SG46_9DINO|nr:unnamed protein product [Polarella glacialis]
MFVHMFAHCLKQRRKASKGHPDCSEVLRGPCEATAGSRGLRAPVPPKSPESGPVTSAVGKDETQHGGLTERCRLHRVLEAPEGGCGSGPLRLEVELLSRRGSAADCCPAVICLDAGPTANARWFQILQQMGAQLRQRRPGLDEAAASGGLPTTGRRASAPAAQLAARRPPPCVELSELGAGRPPGAQPQGQEGEVPDD